MFGNRVSTAQIADDMLNEFYVKMNLDQARAKHNKRVEKRLLQQGKRDLSPLPQAPNMQGMGVSQSLDGAAWQRHAANHGAGNANRSLRPNSKTVRFGGVSKHDYEVIQGSDR
jgi:hypothetical protein